MVFNILLVATLLIAVAAFMAGSLIFITTNAFYLMAVYYGNGFAYFIMVIADILFSYLSLILIRDIFLGIFIKKDDGSRNTLFSEVIKFLISLALFEIFKMFYTKKQRK